MCFVMFEKAINTKTDLMQPYIFNFMYEIAPFIYT